MAGLVVLVILVLSLLWWVRGQTADLPTAAPPSGTSSASATTQPTRPSSTRSVAVDPESGLRVVALADLPPQAAQTVRLIDRDGPFPYAKDGSVFGNNEGLLPRQRRGYYREYTVPTPGESDRGARRIIGGDGGQLYWTADHYASFQVIRR